MYLDILVDTKPDHWAFKTGKSKYFFGRFKCSSVWSLHTLLIHIDMLVYRFMTCILTKYLNVFEDRFHYASFVIIKIVYTNTWKLEWLGNISYWSRIYEAKMKFHTVHGTGITLSDGRTVATRSDAHFCNGIVFSDQPIKTGQKISVELACTANWSGALRDRKSTRLNSSHD